MTAKSTTKAAKSPFSGLKYYGGAVIDILNSNFE